MEVALLCTHFERAKESDCLLQTVASILFIHVVVKRKCHWDIFGLSTCFLGITRFIKLIFINVVVDKSFEFEYLVAKNKLHISFVFM
jgi:hypothetical protein